MTDTLESFQSLLEVLIRCGRVNKVSSCTVQLVFVLLGSRFLGTFRKMIEFPNSLVG